MRRRTGRLAIRHGDVLLAVPPMHPDSPPAVCQLVFEYVLRRQVGLAATVAEMAADVIEGRQAHLGKMAKLLQETPHHTARGMAA